MVRIDRVVTRGGDAGETSLGDGSRLPKHAARIEALGAVDEANAALGLVMLHVSGEAAAMVTRIQNDLFDLGADLCRPGLDGKRITAAPTARIEAEIAAMNQALPPLASFILPGGTPAGAHCHLARTLVRRAERAVTALAAAEPVNPQLPMLLNRLSDHLFVLSRVANGNGDVMWRPSQ